MTLDNRARDTALAEFDGERNADRAAAHDEDLAALIHVP